ncbi:hypothetical protein M728_006042 (plasmid) [Ensifer sp. WSM1721]
MGLAIVGVADRHINCVVDGDTFWLEGEKIRLPMSTHLSWARRDARQNG